MFEFICTWQNATSCFKKKDLRRLIKQVQKASWTSNSSYKITFWWFKCKWIRNIWIKFPLKYTCLKIKERRIWQKFLLLNPKHLKYSSRHSLNSWCIWDHPATRVKTQQSHHELLFHTYYSNNYNRSTLICIVIHHVQSFSS